MNCKYKKIRTKKGIKYGYCSLLKKEVDLYNCKCENTEYKQYKKLEAHTTMKKATYRHYKKDKERFSIIYQDLSNCAICSSNIGINKYEVFYGAYRNLSIKYGCVIPLCIDHHTKGSNAIHNNRELDLYYKRLFQKKFEELYSHELFIETFKKNYL